ncbi:MAG: glycosyltransferase [Candidatus Andersenbacteria bacterium]
MNILYLSKNMSGYAGAFYQKDIMDELSRQHTVTFYGPGFSGYHEEYSLSDVLNTLEETPDLIAVGHAWLSDTPHQKNVNTHPLIQLARTNIPKILFLNKEYVNLRQKLRYAREQKFNLIFSHHHDTVKYQETTGIPTHFLPFAVNMQTFIYNPTTPKDIDFFFSGILQNPQAYKVHNDIRKKVQRLLFHSIGQIYLIKRPPFRRLNVRWQTQASHFSERVVNRIIRGPEKMPDTQYIQTLNRSKLCLNSPSPLNLIGTRYFEAMVMRSLVLCSESEFYDGLFTPGEHCVTFKEDLSDFVDKLFYYTSHADERKEIIERAYIHARDNHTWEHRIRLVTDLVAAL